MLTLGIFGRPMPITLQGQLCKPGRGRICHSISSAASAYKTTMLALSYLYRVNDDEHAMALQVQALRSVEKHLNMDALYVLGTNCVDNGPREGLEKFLNVASSDPDSVPALRVHAGQILVLYSCICC